MGKQDLGSWLVARGALTAARLEDVAQHQVIYGGALDTNILEMSLLPEDELLALLGQFHALPVATAEQLKAAEPEKLRIFPPRLAQKYQAVPFRLEGRNLSIALNALPDLSTLDDIGFMLSVYIRPFAALEVRVHQAMLRNYGVALPARMEHLLAQMGEDADDDRAAWARRSGAPPPSAPPPREAWAVEEPGRSRPRGDSAPPPPPAGLPPPLPADAFAPNADVRRALTIGARDLDALEPMPLSAPLTNATAQPSSPPPLPADALSADLPEPGSSSAAARTAPPPVPGDTDARGSLGMDDGAPSELPEDLPPPPPVDPVFDDPENVERLHRRQERVTWSLADARAELALAQSRDDVVEVLLRFAYKGLSYAAVFVLQGNQFNGWDSIGEDEVPRALARIRIAPAPGTALALVEEMGSHYLGPLKPSDPLPAAVGRASPKAAVLCPFMVKGRLVGVLYGERGAKPISPAHAADLQVLTPDAGRMLESLILRQKRARMGFVDERPAADGPGIRDALNAPSSTGDAAPALPPPVEAPSAEAAPVETTAVVPPSGVAAPVVDAPTTEAPREPSVLPLAPAADAVPAETRVADATVPPTPEAAALVAREEVQADIMRGREERRLRGDPLDAAAPVPTTSDVLPPLRDGESREVVPETAQVDLPEVTDRSPTLQLPAVEAPPAAAEQAAPPPRVDTRGFSSETLEITQPAWVSQRAQTQQMAALKAHANVEEYVAPPADWGTAPPVDVPRDALDAAAISPGSVLGPPPAPPRQGPPPLPHKRAATLPMGSQPAVTTVDPREAAARHAGEVLKEAARARAQRLPDLAESLVRMPADRTTDELLERALGRGTGVAAAVEGLCAHPGLATAAILRAFPGTLHGNPFADDGGANLDVRDLAPLCRVTLRLPDAAAALVAAHGAASNRRESRYVSVLLAREVHHASMAELVARRCFDDEARVSLLAASALHRMLRSADERQVAASGALSILVEALQGTDHDARERAVRAAAVVPDRSFVPALVEILDGRDKDLAEAALRALREITRQDFGNSARRWRSWHKEQAGRRRTEWLIDALDHKEREMRQEAQRDLAALAGEYMGYYFDAPRPEREAAIQRWRTWWDRNRNRADLP